MFRHQFQSLRSIKNASLGLSKKKRAKVLRGFQMQTNQALLPAVAVHVHQPSFRATVVLFPMSKVVDQVAGGVRVFRALNGCCLSRTGRRCWLSSRGQSFSSFQIFASRLSSVRLSGFSTSGFNILPSHRPLCRCTRELWSVLPFSGRPWPVSWSGRR